MPECRRPRRLDWAGRSSCRAPGMAYPKKTTPNDQVRTENLVCLEFQPFHLR
jgi:hypothetical protein